MIYITILICTIMVIGFILGLGYKEFKQVKNEEDPEPSLPELDESHSYNNEYLKAFDQELNQAVWERNQRIAEQRELRRLHKLYDRFYG